MKPEQITAIAREYAESRYPEAKTYEDEYLRDTAAFVMEDKLRWLSQSYCLVEKEVVRTTYQQAMEQGKHAHVKYHVESRAKLRLLESLFPDIAKEVEEWNN